MIAYIAAGIGYASRTNAQTLLLKVNKASGAPRVASSSSACWSSTRDTVHGPVSATAALLRAVADELDQQRDTEPMTTTVLAGRELRAFPLVWCAGTTGQRRRLAVLSRAGDRLRPALGRHGRRA